MVESNYYHYYWFTFFPQEFCIYLLLDICYINNITMKCGISRQIFDPVLAPDQFGVVRPLGPKDLDRCMTRQGVAQHSLPLQESHGVNM